MAFDPHSGSFTNLKVCRSIEKYHLLTAFIKISHIFAEPQGNLLEGLYTKHMMSKLGPFKVDQKYFATRHPLPILTAIKPFSSLEAKFWINYSTLYIVYLISIISTLLLIQSTNLHIIPGWAVISHMQHVQWIYLFGAGFLFEAIFSFSFWTFSVLFEMDLWAALVGQNFESKVETWENISW